MSVKVSALSSAASLDGTEQLSISKIVSGVQTTVKTTTQDVANLATATGRAVTALVISTGVVNIDLSLKSNFTLALTANVTSVTFSNLPSAGYVAEFELEITQDATGGRTLALPAAFKALGGSVTAIASAANAVTVLSAKTFDNGTSWRYAMQESA